MKKRKEAATRHEKEAAAGHDGMRTTGLQVGRTQVRLPTAATGPRNTACHTVSLAVPHTLLLPYHLEQNNHKFILTRDFVRTNSNKLNK